ncbi:MAG: TetR/AcrR family transcriptional regulator [Polyangiaceae bacterium]|nr:TetR/AcrR family transcriptional regulator [Polyangiaceae bacterium]
MNSFGDKPPGKRAPGKRDAQKEETRARILAVARAHFERDGFEAANIRAIAAEAGVAAGTVLLHYADKRDLMHATLFDELSLTIEQALALPAKGPLEERLCAIARTFFAYYEARPKLRRALLREALLAESPWKERFVAQVSRVHMHLATLAGEAKARGELAADVDPVMLGASFFAFYYFALIGWVQGALGEPAPLFERMLAEHLRGLTTTNRKGQ